MGLVDRQGTELLLCSRRTSALRQGAGLPGFKILFAQGGVRTSREARAPPGTHGQIVIRTTRFIFLISICKELREGRRRAETPWLEKSSSHLCRELKSELSSVPGPCPSWELLTSSKLLTKPASSFSRKCLTYSMKNRGRTAEAQDGSLWRQRECSSMALVGSVLELGGAEADLKMVCKQGEDLDLRVPQLEEVWDVKPGHRTPGLQLPWPQLQGPAVLRLGVWQAHGLSLGDCRAMRLVSLAGNHAKLLPGQPLASFDQQSYCPPEAAKEEGQHGTHQPATSSRSEAPRDSLPHPDHLVLKERGCFVTVKWEPPVTRDRCRLLKGAVVS
ncbi:hypothetical protein Cadr_000016150 [Camelus dromedarius]|uniref:Uncharacterized protein n=1 Tax=Camelus dromedarius TaxID=9838 RepID=A0A5N4E9M3_CAMDR|nr:hypothetical protein Cadr_000016150 [Camelus dromedarius]